MELLGTKDEILRYSALLQQETTILTLATHIVRAIKQNILPDNILDIVTKKDLEQIKIFIKGLANNFVDKCRTQMYFDIDTDCYEYIVAEFINENHVTGLFELETSSERSIKLFDIGANLKKATKVQKSEYISWIVHESNLRTSFPVKHFAYQKAYTNCSFQFYKITLMAHFSHQDIDFLTTEVDTIEDILNFIKNYPYIINEQGLISFIFSLYEY
jgi:hypothetical protein